MVLKRNAKVAGLSFAILALLALVAFAEVAPDATPRGPFATTSAEYKLPAELDPEINPDLETELWARLYRPKGQFGSPLPVLIFLHGNHYTCGHFVDGDPARVDDRADYTFSGTCPPGYVVVPSHAGYTYLADQLASWGYIVVSINANRGINAAPALPGDIGLNLARGKLVLKHLEQLSIWNTSGGWPPSLGVDLTGQLDFSQLGLLGHSRGGEGMRAAYTLYQDPGSPWPGRIPDPLTFRGIFEIGPVDGQTSRVLDANGVPWTVLLPMCDGDVSNLQGIKPLDRMVMDKVDDPPTQKSSFTVWGANHNYYNTEWQHSDSSGCVGPDNIPLFLRPVGSPKQRKTALASGAAFFRGNVGGAVNGVPARTNPDYNRNFNPQFDLPSLVTSITRVDRGYTDSPHPDVTKVFEDFINPTGTSTYGFPNEASNITIVHGVLPNHDQTRLRAGLISWNSPGASTYFQTNWSAPGTGRNITRFRTLDVRLARQCDPPQGTSCTTTVPLNPAGPTSFSILLALADGTFSNPVPLKQYTDLRGPVGGTRGGLHPILQTARIPLTAFAGTDLTDVQGVRLTFDDTATGAIYVANVRLSTRSGVGAAAAAASTGAPRRAPGPVSGPGAPSPRDINVIKRIRTVPRASVLQGRRGVEIELHSSRAFTVRDELLVLRIGAQEFKLSRYPRSGDTHTVTFTLPFEAFAKAVSGDRVLVQYGDDPSDAWNFGRLDKSLLDK